MKSAILSQKLVYLVRNVENKTNAQHVMFFHALCSKLEWMV